MDSNVALDNVEAQARNTASSLAMVKRTMKTWATMTSTQPELKVVLRRLRSQSTKFDSTIRKSITMFKSSAETAKQVEELLSNIKTLDSAGLEEMAESLAWDVKKTARQVKEIYGDLRDINSELAEISQEVTELDATFHQQKRETQTEYGGTDSMRNRANEKADSARERKREMLVTRGVGTVILGWVPPAALLWWGVTTGLANKARKDTERYRSRAAELESELESLQRQINLLKKSEKKTRAIRKALPDLMEGFNSMYDFYVKIDTQVADIRINPKAKGRLTYEQYARRWGQLHKQLEEHHTQITYGIEWSANRSG